MHLNKPTLRRIRNQIDRVLWKVWDPIGVNDDPEWARDEYRNYVGEVFELLISGATDKAIADYLDHVSESRMGLGAGYNLPPTIAALRNIDLSPLIDK